MGGVILERFVTDDISSGAISQIVTNYQTNLVQTSTTALTAIDSVTFVNILTDGGLVLASFDADVTLRNNTSSAWQHAGGKMSLVRTNSGGGDAVLLNDFQIKQYVVASDIGRMPTFLSFVDTPAAGAWTYTPRWASNGDMPILPFEVRARLVQVIEFRR